MHSNITPPIKGNSALLDQSKPDSTREPQRVEIFANEGDLKRRLYETSKQLVQEAEKNVSLALDLDRTKDELRNSKDKNKQLRLYLLQGINGGTFDAENYEHLPLNELLRIRLKEFEVGGKALSVQTHYSSLPNKKQMKGHPDSTRSQSSNHSQQKYDTEGAQVQSCQDDCIDPVRIQIQLEKMSDRSRRDREIKHRLQKQLEETNKKVNALSDHIEKLLVHLKHEAITKAKAITERGRCQKEVEILKKRNQIMEKKNARKDLAINDLKEGGKLLEDQLSLMDEKYMELRMKLDWTRTQTEKILRRKDDEIKAFRLQELQARMEKKAARSKVVKKNG